MQSAKRVTGTCARHCSSLAFKEVSLSCKQATSQNKLTHRCRVFAEKLTVAFDIARFLLNPKFRYRVLKCQQVPGVNHYDYTFLKLALLILFLSLLSP